MSTTPALLSADFGVELPLALRRRVAWRLLPYLFLLYIAAFLDRVNVSYAALTMKPELGFSADVLGLGFGIFFCGYFLLEIPSTVIVERWSARRWIARIMITWGIVAAAMGLMHTARMFYILRFLLGAAEAGFFPGLIVYLGHWFTRRDRAKAVGVFMASLPVSYIIGAPISGRILSVHWLGLSGWRWIFILEGLPAVLLGLLTLLILTDRPAQATWLSESERTQLQAALDAESKNKPEHIAPNWTLLACSVLALIAAAGIWILSGSFSPVTALLLKAAAIGAGFLCLWLLTLSLTRDAESKRARPMLILLTLIYFLTICGAYGFGLWLPLMLKPFHYSNFDTALLAALPYVVSLAAMIWFGWHSDKTGKRRWHTAIPFFIAGAGFSLGGIFPVHGLVWTMVGFALVGAGIYSYMPSFWTLPSLYLSGTAVAVATGLINSFANLGGFVGPYLMGVVNQVTGKFAWAMGAMVAAQILAGLLVFTLKSPSGKRI